MKRISQGKCSLHGDSTQVAENTLREPSFSPRTPEEFADGIGAVMYLLMVDGLLG